MMGTYIVTSVKVTYTDTYSITTAPTASAITYGQPLSASELTGGAATWNGNNVPGTFAWTDGDTVPPVGTASYSVTFTPSDTSFKSDTTQVSVTVNKATPSVTPPTANSLIYNGTAQELVTAGSTNMGTLLYSLDGTNYSSEIPTGTAKGDYTVYYKVAGTDNWDEVTGQVNVTISSYTPLLQMTADSSKMFLNVYVPYVGSSAPTVTYGGDVQSLTSQTINNKQYGVFTISCAAKNIVDSKTLVVTDGNNQLYSGNISAAGYLKSINSGNYEQKYKTVAIAMLRYGSAAQKVLNYKPTDLANDGVDAAALNTLNSVTMPAQTYTADQISGAFSTLVNSEYYGMNMTYTYDTTLLIAFKIKSGVDENEAKSELVELFNCSADNVVKDTTGKYWVVKVQNIRIGDLANTQFTVGNVKILATDYLSRIVADSSKSNDLKNLCKALYAYHTAAKAL